MKRLHNLVPAITMVMLSGGTAAATYSSGAPLLCSLQSVSECIADRGCKGITPQSVNLPDFIQVDSRKSLLTSTPDSGIGRKTPIERRELLDGRLILQGADDGIEGERDGLAWSMAIDEVNGKMVLSASGDAFALVAFGACTLR